MEDFEKIFKEKLEKHNGKVKAGAWAGISAGVAGQAATGSGIFSSTALTYVASIAATIVITSSVILWNYSEKPNNNTPKQTEQIVVSEEIDSTELDLFTEDKQMVENLSNIDEDKKEENYVITEPTKKDTKKVEVKKIDKAELYTKIITSPSGGFAPLTVSFSHESTKGLMVHWDFADGTESYVNSPSHKFTKAGVYNVVLTATNDKGESISEEKTIEIKENSYIRDVTKTLKKDDKGVYNEFVVETKNLETYHLTIFTNEGDFVFESKNPDTFWDGTRYGKELLSGVYLYTIKAKGVDGKEYEFDGQVTLK